MGFIIFVLLVLFAASILSQLTLTGGSGIAVFGQSVGVVRIEGPIVVPRVGGLTSSFEESCGLRLTVWLRHSVKSLSTRMMYHFFILIFGLILSTNKYLWKKAGSAIRAAIVI